MSVTDFNNGFITGLSLNGVVFANHSGEHIKITAIESNTTQLRVKFNDDTDFTVFNRSYDAETDTHTFFCVSNGSYVILSPLPEGEIIYTRVEV